MDVDEDYMRNAVELYGKEGMAAVKKAFPKCQHTMTIARYRKALAGTSGQRAHFRFLKSKIKAYLKEKKEMGLKINRGLAEKAYQDIKDSCINGDRLKVCPRLLNKIVKEVIREMPDEDFTIEEVDWVDVNDLLEDDTNGYGLGTSRDLEASCGVPEDDAGQGNVQVIAIDGQPILGFDSSTTAMNVRRPNVTGILPTVNANEPPGVSVSGLPVPRLKWSKVLLIGDSATELSFDGYSNWGALLSNKLVRVADVINRGFVGYNTRWYKSIIRTVIGEWPPNTVSCVVLNFGMIDAAAPDCPTRQHVPYNEFKTNLNEIIAAINSHGVPSSRIIMVGPPFFDMSQFKKHRKEMRNASQIVRKGSETVIYNKGANQVARSNGIDYIDLYNIIKEKREESPLLDGLHLSPLGSTLLYKKLKPMVIKKINAYHGNQNLEQVGETWQEIAKRSPKPIRKIPKNALEEENE